MLINGLFLALLISGYCHAENLVIKTSLGSVRGHHKTSFDGRKFAAFEGIPYAKPPIGARRFAEPEPIEPWTGTWNADFLTVCAQTEMIQTNKTAGDEDCLYINVYVPRENPSPHENLEVVIHIHGGAYMYASGHAYSKPEHLMDRDVIFVTFNYRLGILGFLSTEDDVVPGNNGLKDQVLALKWVKDNIASFGGNPDSITLTGMSAGASSVHLHYFSDLSKGLFHRGLSQSGTALNAWSIGEEPLSRAKKLADAVGCPTDCTKKLVNCLRQRPFEHILSKMPLFFTYLFIPIVPFGPVVEKGGSRPFLKDEPYNLLIKGRVQDVPWIDSTTIHEGLFLLAALPDLEFIKKNWEEQAPYLLDFNYTLAPASWKSASQKIRKFYLGNGDINDGNYMKLVQMFSDRLFINAGEQAARLQAKVNKSPVYYFTFGYYGDEKTNKGVQHGAEIRYMFGSVFSPETFNSNDIKMKDLLLDMLVSYAKTGEPKVAGVEWKPTSHDKLTYLNIAGFESTDLKLETTEGLSDRNFWNSLKIRENENLAIARDEL